MKKIIKEILFAVALVLSVPFFCVYGVGVIISGRDGSFAGMSQLLSLIPGMTGVYIRRAFYCCTVTKCSRDSHISFGTIFPSRNVSIGNHVYIGAWCIIADSVIEDDVLIGSNVHIMGGTAHRFDRMDIPIRLQGGSVKTVTIGTDAWLGNGAIVMADVGAKCIVGAGSVVTKRIEQYSIVAGNPARIIRKRIG